MRVTKLEVPITTTVFCLALLWACSDEAAERARAAAAIERVRTAARLSDECQRLRTRLRNLDDLSGALQASAGDAESAQVGEGIQGMAAEFGRAAGAAAAREQAGQYGGLAARTRTDLGACEQKVAWGLLSSDERVLAKKYVADADPAGAEAK